MLAVLEQIEGMSVSDKLKLVEYIMKSISQGDKLARKRESNEVYDYLMSQTGWLPNDYSFDREEANA